MEAERSRKSNRGGTAHCNRGPSGPRIAMKGPSRAEVVPRRPRAVIQKGRTVRWRKGQRQPNKQKTTANHSLQAESPLKQVKNENYNYRLSMGLNSRKKSMAAQRGFVLQQSLQKVFKWTSPLSDQRPQHGVAKPWSRCRSGALQCSNAGCIHVKMEQWYAVLHAVEKTFLVAQPIQVVALTSPEAC